MRISGKTFSAPAIQEKLGAFSSSPTRVDAALLAPRPAPSPRSAMPTYGTHTPDVKYVPSSLMAFGYKGVKPVPGVPNMYLKDYQDNLWELDVRSIRPAAPETRSSHPR